ncbi:MAG TPA: autotransporter domain-containing protein [Luteibacter sp.]|nr:autotransporter domain-containing protein [Luteibacter sp.]
MKKYIAVLGLLALFEEGQAMATNYLVSNGQTSGTAQSLVAGDTSTVDAGGILSLAGKNNAITFNGSATVVNNGSILQTGTGRAILDNAGHNSFTVTNNAGAVMQTADGDVIQMSKASNSIVFYNYGTLTSNNASAGGAQAIDFNGITSGSNALYNYASGVIQANEADAVRPGVNGFVYNDGIIRSTNNPGTNDSSDGVDLQANSGITVVNATTGSQTLSGTGLIEGARHGITGGNTDTTTDGTFTLNVTNNRGGTIQGDNGSGVNIDGFNNKELVTIVNHGTIVGSGMAGDGDGVDVDGLVNVTNTGTILSKQAFQDTSEGMTVGGGTIVNSGTIEGDNINGGASRGITLAGIDKDPVTDAPFATPQGIYGDTTVTNSGLIKGQNGAGIAVTGVATAYALTITNLAGGTIEGGGTTEAAIDTGANNATVIDYGTITADASGKAINLGSGNSNLQILGGTAVVNGDISGGTGTSTLAIAPGAGNSFNYGGVISDFSSVAVGAGTVTLDGANTYAGDTTITGGTLVVGDAASPKASLAGNVDVATGGTLRGHGTIGGNVVNDGTVAPGGSIGTLTITGNYTQNKDGVLTVNASPDGQSDRLAVGGKATILGGGTVVLAQAGNWSPRTEYTILTAGQGISGQFDSVTSSLAFLTPTLSYTADAVNLSLERNNIAFVSLARTRDQAAVAVAADALGFDSPVYTSLAQLDAGSVPKAFDQLAGQLHASMRTALLDDSRYVRDAINNHLLGLTSAADGKQAGDANGVTAWTSAWGHWGDNEGNANAARMQANGSGVLVGADIGVGASSRLGVVAGSGQTSVRVDDLGSSAHATATHLGFYGSTAIGGFQLQAGADYAWQQIDSTRHIAFGNFAETASGRYDADTAQAYVDGGYRFDLGGHATLEPYLNLAEVQVKTDGFTESGSSAALAVQGDTSKQTVGTLGLRASFELAPDGIRAHAGLGWQHAWGDLVPGSTQSFAAGGVNSFSIDGVPVAHNAMAATLGVSFPIGSRTTIDASYQGQFADHAKDQAARMNLTVAF